MARHLEHRLKLQQLRIVATIASHGSITAASRVVGLSQPTLTKTLHDLETALGLQLFVRNPLGVEPTEAGRAVIETAERVLAELTRLDEVLDAHAAKALGRAAIGTSPAAAASLIPYVLADFQKTAPELCVEITEGESDLLLAALTGGSVDLVIGDLLGPSGRDGLKRRVLCEDEAVLVARAEHPIFDGEVTFERAALFDLIVPPPRRRFGSDMREALANLPHFRPKIIPSTSIGFAREMVKATDGIALASRLMMSADILQGTARVLPLRLGFASMPFGIVYRGDDGLPKSLVGFVECLRATIGALTLEIAA